MDRWFAEYQWYRYWRAGAWHQVKTGRFGTMKLHWITDDRLAELSSRGIKPEIVKTETWLG